MSHSNNTLFTPILFILLSNPLFSANTEISGHVFQDLPIRNVEGILELNTYGQKENNELGLADINVTAYPDNISTLTDSNGSWSLATTQNSRIEFSNIPSYLKESPSGNTNNTSIQFIQKGNNTVTFGLHDPSDFSSTTNPPYVVNLQENGTHRGSDLASLHFVNYTAKGLNNHYHDFSGNAGTGPRPKDTITVDLIGSVWGKAYQKNKKRLFVASMLQRHVGYANNSASIYIVDYSNNSTDNNKVSHFSLQGKSPSNGGENIDLGTIIRNDLRDNPEKPNVDINAYANVGKMSYGGIDIDDNSNTLWLINLNQKAIISHNISSNDVENGETKQYPLDGKNNLPTCTDGQLRPWALKIHEGRGYIGAICDAINSKSTDNLSAHVFSFDLKHPTNGFRTELNLDLNYRRQLEGWHAWEDTYVNGAQRHKDLNVYDQPILSDIEFDEYNNMYIAFLDRYATQLGRGNYAIRNFKTEKAYSYGEILRVCNNRGTYEVEGTGTCKQSNYTDIFDQNITEFFNDTSGSGTLESSLGSLAILKGSRQLLNTIVNPHPEDKLRVKRFWNTEGIQTFSTDNGSIQNWYSNAMTNGKGLNGKANGLGDIELITDSAPIEIGNRIWFDSNSNGIQDANEHGIKNVKIHLICKETLVAEAITNTNGNYIFSNNANTPTLPNENKKSHIYNITQLSENNINECSIHIPNIKGNNQQDSLKRYTLTSKNIQGVNNLNLIDSDAIIHQNSAKISILPKDINTAGTNNHSFDIGFKQLGSVIIPPVVYPPVETPSTVIIGNKIWIEDDHDGDATTGTISFLSGIIVTATASNGTKYEGITNNNGHYLITVPKNDTYVVSFEIPDRYFPTANSQDNYISDSDIENDRSHDNEGTTILITTHDNLSVDFGLSTTAILGVSTCQEMIINDDIENANEENSITTIDILYNDIGNKSNQQVKILSMEEGKSLWLSGDKNITSIHTFDTLTVEGEGEWNVIDNKIIFTALKSFDGKIPTPIYYIVEGTDCTEETKYTNVAKIMINTPCHCPSYENDSVSTLNIYSLLLFMILTLGVSYTKLRDSIN